MELETTQVCEIRSEFGNLCKHEITKQKSKRLINNCNKKAKCLKNGTKFKCNVCNFIATDTCDSVEKYEEILEKTRSTIEDHIKTNHPEICYKCKTCQKPFVTKKITEKCCPKNFQKPFVTK